MPRTLIFAVLVLCFCVHTEANAQTPSSGQTAGGVSRQELDQQRQQRLEERINQPPVTAVEEPAAQTESAPSGPSVMVQSIQVEGATLLSPAEVRNIVAPFEGRTMAMDGMQQAADAITDAYRKKGFVTSRAYIPVQSIKGGTLVIKVVEVKTGTVEIRGNKYFKTERLQKELGITPSGYFDFSALQRSLVFINEHPDRLAKAILVPGKEPGTTDIIIDVADQRPMHVGAEYNNYGSRFIGGHQFAAYFENNNLTGNDDILYIRGQLANDDHMDLAQLRYLFPFTQRWDVGFYALNSHVDLTKDFEDLDAVGKAQVLGVFATNKLFRNKNVDLRLNAGFDYKSIRDELLGVEVSHDELRIVKGGFDLDVEDTWGRNILTAQMESGLADILGASDDKDSSSSRAGAGGRFDKGVFTFFRLQPTPFATSLLLKNTAQVTNHNLPASEQFQIGGPLSVRGYAPAEFSGDNGIYSAAELSIPIYPLAKSSIHAPFFKDVKLYDALRLVIFYDLATVHLNNPQAGEQTNTTLRGYGFGMRLNVRENLTFRVEAGWPQGKIKPSDGKSSHVWVELTVKF